MKVNDHESNPCQERLRRHPLLFASIGVVHTLLTAGIVFGWASLLPILRQEGLHLTPSEFASIFTHGAIGNYLSSLPFGYCLDRLGPKHCGMLASVLFALGLVLCSGASALCLDVGFALLGFSGPAIQLPTLHLAKLFPGKPVEGGTGGAALFMSAQAGAFDGGTMVFALLAALQGPLGLSSPLFFRLYLIVPLFTFLTAGWFWPNEILEDGDDQEDGPNRERRQSFAHVGSPYLSPASFGTLSLASSLQDAPLSVVFWRPQFYCLALWVSVHILKLNFVVASLNDQLEYAFPSDPATAHTLIHFFGAMLPFGFVVLPIVARMLSRSTMVCFQVANLVGCLYGSVLTFMPDQALIVFTSVATSRQLVYSTVFHQTGELFGFKNYGVLLGLTNIVVSSMSMLQGPLVKWAESHEDYFGPNFVLLLLTLPLFGIVYGATAPENDTRSNCKGRFPVNEQSNLLAPTTRGRSLSDAAAL
jgi:MFS family permease